jgi:UDP:flavonoid glycosyltransferase YjiC (YdhE family)
MLIVHCELHERRRMHFGIVVPGFRGHLNPGSTLGVAIQRRGHQVTLISTPEAEEIANRCGLCFCPISVPEYQSGELAKDKEILGRLEGMQAFRHNVDIVAKAVNNTYRDLPAILDKNQFDALLIDDTWYVK